MDIVVHLVGSLAVVVTSCEARLYVLGLVMSSMCVINAV